MSATLLCGHCGKALCAVCGTCHPQVGPGQPLLLPRSEEARREVIRAHLLDEANKAGPGGVTVGEVLSRLVGEVA